MSRFDYRKFRTYFIKYHNVHVKLAIRKSKQERSASNGLVISRRLDLLQSCLIDGDDTAQMILLKELFFWIDLGYLSDRIDAVAAVPEWWQLRPEAKRPQLVILYKEQSDTKAGRDLYPLTIPHYEGSTPPGHSPIPAYRKGQQEGILTLSDNSKVIVNAYSEAEAHKVLTAAKKCIKPKYLKGSHIKIGERKGQKLKQIQVSPHKAKFFPTGQQDLSPKWVAKFKL